MASTKFTQFAQASNTSETEISVGVKGGSNFKRLNNMTATTAPTVTDDGSDGYTVGSTWFDTTTGTLYVCSDSTNGAAVWVVVSGIPLTGTSEGAPLTGVIEVQSGYLAQWTSGDIVTRVGFNEDGDFFIERKDLVTSAVSYVFLANPSSPQISLAAYDGTNLSNFVAGIISGEAYQTFDADKIGFFNKATPSDASTQAAAIADATNTTDVITQLNTLLAAMRAYGLIAE